MNPWAYDANGNLTDRARTQETARTRPDTTVARKAAPKPGCAHGAGPLTVK